MATAGPSSTPGQSIPSTPSDVNSPFDTKSFLYSVDAEAGPSTPLELQSTAVLEYAVDDEYEAVDPERRLLSPTDDADRAPWANAVDRAKRAALRLPGVERSVDVINWILGPRVQRPPPPPTSLALTCALTGGRKNVSAPLDAMCVRTTRRGKLSHYYLLYLALWATGFILLIRAAYYLPNSPDAIGCTAAMWNDWPPDYCGLHMTECSAMLQEGTYRCPGGCQLVKLGNERWVGAENVNKQPLVIGGEGGVYRADSWVCAAGLHAGLISKTYGGCLRIKPRPYPEGSKNFTGSRANGISAVTFAPSFPGAFELEATGSWSECMEYHWPITAFNVVALFIFTALFEPSPGVLLAVLLIMGYSHLVLVADPPYRPPNWSKFIGGIPAALLAGFWAWHVSFRRSLNGFYAARLPLETAIWQGAGLWIGLESSTLFARIPIARLGYDNLGADGILAITIVIILVVLVVFIQARSFRRLGLVRYYLVRYLPLVPILIVLANLGNDYYLRLHHFLLSLAGMPVMSLPNRISLFGQAFCLGFFLDGIGRWGWASIVEGGAALLGDAQAGSAMPEISTVLGPNGAVTWPAINATLIAQGIISVAVLFDDVLVRANYTQNNFTIADGTDDLSTDHYFRMAYNGNGTSLDYTDPLTWYASNQSWSAVNPTAADP